MYKYLFDNGSSCNKSSILLIPMKVVVLMINLTNESLFFCIFKPKFKLSVEKKSKKSCSNLLVYLLYEVIFFTVLSCFEVDFNFIVSTRIMNNSDLCQLGPRQLGLILMQTQPLLKFIITKLTFFAYLLFTYASFE